MSYTTVARGSIAGSLITSFMLASLAFAQVDSGTAGVVATTTVAKPRNAVNGECVATAVGIREEALIAAQNAQNAAIGTALTARKTELMAAWKLADNKVRAKARDAAWVKFRTARKDANKSLSNAVKAAHNAFNAATKACGVNYREAPEPAAAVSI